MRLPHPPPGVGLVLLVLRVHSVELAGHQVALEERRDEELREAVHASEVRK